MTSSSEYEAANDRADETTTSTEQTPTAERMPTGRAWVLYTVVRLAAFAVVFAALYFALQPWQWAWLAALIVATIVGLLVSMIFLRNARLSIGASIQEHREHTADTRTRADREEDALLDAAERHTSAGRDD